MEKEVRKDWNKMIKKSCPDHNVQHLIKEVLKETQGQILFELNEITAHFPVKIVRSEASKWIKNMFEQFLIDELDADISMFKYNSWEEMVENISNCFLSYAMDSIRCDYECLMD